MINSFIDLFQIPLGSNPEDRANQTTPEGFRIKLSTIPGAGFGGFAERFVPKHTIIGSYEGITHTHHKDDDLYSWQVSGGIYFIQQDIFRSSSLIR